MQHVVRIDVFVDEPDTDDPSDTFLRVQRALDEAGYGDTVGVSAEVFVPAYAPTRNGVLAEASLEMDQTDANWTDEGAPTYEDYLADITRRFARILYGSDVDPESLA